MMGSMEVSEREQSDIQRERGKFYVIKSRGAV